MCRTNRKVAAAVFLIAGMLGLASSHPSEPSEETSPREKRETKAQPAPRREADRSGSEREDEPLPASALARLGTTRLRHGNSIHSLAVSPDGRKLVTIGRAEEGSLRLWDLATGKLIRELRGERWPHLVSFSPDGQMMTSGGSDGSVYFYRTANRIWRRQTRDDSNNSISSLTFSPDSKIVAAGSKDIVLWDIESVKLLRRIPREWNFVESLAFSPNGKLLAAEDSKVVCLWDPATGKKVRSLEGELLVQCVAFTSDGKFLAAGGWNECNVYLWEVSTGKRVRVFKGHHDSVASLAISPDGKLLATGGGVRAASQFEGSDHTIRIWEIATGRTVRIFPGNAHTVYGLAFTPDGKTLITGTDLPRLWDVATGKRRLDFASHEHGVVDLCFLPGNAIRTVSLDGTSRTWEAATGREIQRLTLPTRTPFAVALAARGEHIACADQEGGVYVAAASAGRSVRQWHDKDIHPANGLAISPDGGLLVVRKPPYFRLYDVATGELVHSWKDYGTHDRGVDCPVFSPDGRYVAWANRVPELKSDDNAVYIRDLKEGVEFRKIQLDRPASALTFSPDGRTLAIGEQSARHVRGWEVASGKPRWTLTPPEQFHSDSLEDGPMHLQFAPNGRLLALGGGTTVQLWDTVRQERLRLLSGHQDHIASLVFSPNGNLLASGSWDTTALIWDLKSMQEKKQPSEELSIEQLRFLWAALAETDAEKAYQAIRKLAAAPRQTVPFLREQLQQAKPADARLIDRLIADLESEHFRVREDAVAELERLGRLAEPALRRTLAGNPLLETRLRLKPLLEKLAQRHFSAEELRLLRAVETLESSDGSEGRQLLEVLTRGRAAAWLAREAKASLERLAKLRTSQP